MAFFKLNNKAQCSKLAVKKLSVKLIKINN